MKGKLDPMENTISFTELVISTINILSGNLQFLELILILNIVLLLVFNGIVLQGFIYIKVYLLPPMTTYLVIFLMGMNMLLRRAPVYVRAIGWCPRLAWCILYPVQKLPAPL